MNYETVVSAFAKFGFVSKVETNIQKSEIEKIEQKSLDPEVVLKSYLARNFKDKDERSRLLKKGLEIVDKVRAEYEI